MKVYVSGISGSGMGPLALMAQAAGMTVFGSDLAKGDIYEELKSAGIEMQIGPQDEKFFQQKIADGIDWFVYTSALPEDHAELKLAREAGIKCTKRDDFTAFLVKELKLKMVAVAGTHGKTTTTAMIIWAATQLGLPAAYIVGTTLNFAPSGAYHAGDQFFIYEADEYDRNFLKFHPWLAILPAVSYDHPDIYPTKADYIAAFEQFKSQSEQIITEVSDEAQPEDFSLAGAVRRYDASLAYQAIHAMAPQLETTKIIDVLNQFPGVGRRFERIAEGIYSDYAHHPEEIAATIEVARDEAEKKGYCGVTVIYQPHQNIRQHQVRDGYHKVFLGADKIYWLPTYLTREDPNLAVLTPADLIADLENKDQAETAQPDESLYAKILEARENGQLVLLLTAGPADAWLRAKVQE